MDTDGRVPPAHKQRLSRSSRLLRLAKSTLDPRAWLHLVKIVNYYNHTHVAPLRKVSLGADASISPDAVFSYPERISIGDHVRIGSRCHIWAGPGSGSITIGNDVLFGPEVMLTAATYRHEDGAPVSAQAMREADIVIGNDVWLATRALVLPGSRIGDGSIIAAGAVVNGNVEPGTIMAGSPARQVGTRTIQNTSRT